MPKRLEVQPGTLSLMILGTLDVLGPLHGYGIARRIEEMSKDRLSINHGTIYPVLMKLSKEGAIVAKWRATENHRRAKYYALTPAGRRLFARERKEWKRTAGLMAAFLAPSGAKVRR